MIRSADDTPPTVFRPVLIAALTALATGLVTMGLEELKERLRDLRGKK